MMTGERFGRLFFFPGGGAQDGGLSIGSNGAARAGKDDKEKTIK
jgi:hypothetical protein